MFEYSVQRFLLDVSWGISTIDACNGQAESRIFLNKNANKVAPQQSVANGATGLEIVKPVNRRRLEN